MEVDVRLEDKDELTVPAVGGDIMYIKRKSAGGGFSITDYKIKVSNLVSNYLTYADDNSVPDVVAGTSYFNTTLNELRGFDGTRWYNLLNRDIKVTLSAAELKTSNTIPIEVIPPPGVGKAIIVTDFSWKFNWGSVAFDMVTLFINNSITNDPGLRFQDGGLLINRVADDSRVDYIGAFGTLLDNEGVVFTGSIDSVATGDSTVDVNISYKIIIL